MGSSPVPADQAVQAKRRILVATSLATSLIMLDLNIVAVSLPSIARELGAGLADIEWVQRLRAEFRGAAARRRLLCRPAWAQAKAAWLTTILSQRDGRLMALSAVSLPRDRDTPGEASHCSDENPKSPGAGER